MLKVLDLFSGIGGFSLGLERTGGFETVAFCEIEPFPRMVLNKHWPDVPIFEDVTKLDAEQLKAKNIEVDVICGGFPCQDISSAGKGAGLNGKRSGLWYEFHRLIKEIKPQYAIIENVSILRSRGLEEVLRSLAEIGYDAEWHCIPASAVGAPHQRDRIWIVAYARREHGNPGRVPNSARPKTSIGGQAQHIAERRGSMVADTTGERVQGLRSSGQQKSYSYVQKAISMCLCEGIGASHWEVEPDVGRVVDGFPKRVDRLKALGNAVVPQIPEIIGHAILNLRL